LLQNLSNDIFWHIYPGFDLYFIQGILGHKKIETTIGYLGATRKALALKMVDSPYFKE